MGTKEVIFSVDHREFNKTVLKFLKSKNIPIEEYNVVVEEELLNGSGKSFDVTGKLDNSFYKFDLPKLMRGNWVNNTLGILDWMCYSGEIEAGKYIVSASW